MQRRLHELEPLHFHPLLNERAEERLWVGVAAQRDLDEPVLVVGALDHAVVPEQGRDPLAATRHAQRNVPRAMLRLHGRDRAVEHRLAAGDDAHRVAEALGVVHEVRREDHRLPAAAQLDDGVLERLGVDRVEPAERLVENDDIGVVEQSADELHLLLHAARKLVYFRIAPVLLRRAEREPLEPLVDAPVGIRGGTFLWKPSIELSRGYDTNPTRVPSGPSSGLTVLTPELNAKSEWSQHELALALRGSYTAYDKLTDSNRPMLETKATGRIDVSRDTAINLEGRYYLSTDYPGSPNLTAGLARLPISQTFGGSAGVTQRFNHLELLFKAGADRTMWNESQLTDGSTFANTDRNLNQYSGQARASYEVFPGVKPFVEVAGDPRVHDERFDRNGMQRNSKALTPKVGTTFEISKKLTGEVAAGYVMRKYEDPNLADLKGFTIDGSLAWQATGLTTATDRKSTRLNSSHT